MCPTAVRVWTLGIVALGCSQPKSTPDAGTRDPVCGELHCELFDTPQAALARVMEEDPRVLAVGETHAQAGVTARSTTSRFAGDLLPELKGQSTNLVLELWVANGACNRNQKKNVQQVASAQREITKTQRPTDTSDFIALYNGARANGMKPHILVPPCDEYAALADAGAGDVDAMLRMVARLTEEKIVELLASTNDRILAYGGAMHNDIEPRAGHAHWSFGPAIAKQAKYVELDLIVPEMIGDGEAWQAQPWYAHYTKGAQGKKTLLYTVHPHAYALIFPL